MIGLLIGLFFTTIGLLVLIGKYKPFRQWQIVKNTPLGKTNSVATGRSQLFGKVRKYDDIDPILENTEYAYVSVNIEKETNSDSDNNNWKTVHSGCLDSNLILEDDRGKIKVLSPNNAIKIESEDDISLSFPYVKKGQKKLDYTRHKCGDIMSEVFTSDIESYNKPESFDELPNIIKEFCDRNSIEFDPNLKYTIQKIKDEEECFVHIGVLDDRDEDGMRVCGIDSSNNSYILASKSENELIEDLKFKWKSLFIGGVFVTLIGSVFLFVGLSNLGII